MEFFITLAIIAIIAGGVLSAFSARRPSRLIMWAVAYLVLIVGVVQVGLAVGWQLLELPVSSLAITGFVAFNLGNILVIVGRWFKSRTKNSRFVVYGGGALLGASSLLLGIPALSAEMSWTLGLFLSLIVIILVSMPIGLFLSARSHTSSSNR